MNRALTDAQYSAVVGVIARVPIEQARRRVLEKLQESLPSIGKIGETQLADAINSALASFTPGSYHLSAHDGVWRASGDFGPEPSTLLEAAEQYQRTLKDYPVTYWPPIPPRPPLTPEQQKATAEKVVAMTSEQATETYAKAVLGDAFDADEFAQRVAEAKARRAAQPEATLGEIDSAGAVNLAPSEYTEIEPEPELRPLPENERAQSRSEAIATAIALSKRRRFGARKPPPKAFF